MQPSAADKTVAAARHSRDSEQGRLCKQLVVQGRTEWIFATAQCWHVTALTGKGYGVVATRTIGRGERIMAESPLATCTKHAYRAHDARIFARTVDSLPPAQRAAFYALSQSELLYGTQKTAEGVWRSNAYAVHGHAQARALTSYQPAPHSKPDPVKLSSNRYPTVEHSDGSSEGSVFAVACRINHACAPNAHISWSKALAKQTVHAMYEIAAGDEITVSYAHPGSVCAARRSHLRNKFGFDCTCVLCALTGEALQASDVRQRQLAALAVLLAVPHASRASKTQTSTVDLVAEKLHLLKAEGLPIEWAHMDMVEAFTVCCVAGDFAAARPWMNNAIQAAQTMLGKDSKVVHDLEGVLSQ
jgi:hypothetical protein